MRVNKPRNLRSTAKYFSLFIIAIWLFCISPAAVNAAVYIVTTTSDSGAGSLRQAIADANSNAGADTINFDTAGLFATPQTITLTSGELSITDDLAISGTGADKLTISGNNVRWPVFLTLTDHNVTISGLTISGGHATQGGGIFNRGTLTIHDCIVSGNRAVGGKGGGILNLGALKISNSTVSSNTATSSFGDGFGGGIYNEGTLTVDNSTLSHNNCSGGFNIICYGGGIANAGTLTVNNSTVASNGADIGAGIRNSGVLNLNSSIVAINIRAASDIFGPVSSGDYNLIGNLLGITGTLPGTQNITGVDPMLGPLQFNGGSTMTRALLLGSPAIDRGKNSNGLANDQRGQPRTINDLTIADAVLGDGTDIGAVESNYLIVNTTAQDDDGSCQPLSDGDCTFREAILAANAAVGTETIVFNIPTTDPGYDSVANRYTITLTSVLPNLNSDMSVNGLGAKHLTIRRDTAATAFRVFTVNSEKTVTITGLTISSGLADEGGGIKNVGALTITACDIRENSTREGAAGANSRQSNGGDAGHGGAIHNEGSLVINFSSFSSNRTGNGGDARAAIIGVDDIAIGGDGGRGGAIYNFTGTLVIRNSTFSNNRTGDGGDATATAKAASAQFPVSATATGGDGGEGGAIYNNSSLSIANTTITGNGVGRAGRGQASTNFGNELEKDGEPGTGSVFNDVSGSFVLDSTIVANTNVDEDIHGNVSAGDYNLVEDMSGILPGTHNIIGIDPMLGPLAYNGGPTMTHAFQCGSPAIDQGKNVGASGTDQRGAGFARTFDDPAIGNAADGDGTDIGAFELPPNTAPTLTYQAQAVVFNGSLTVNPTAIPSDNGSVKSIVKQSTGTFTGDISVNSATGAVFITNAAPAGTHTITIRATDNCGTTTDASFSLTVSKGTQTIAFGALANKTFGDPDFTVSAIATSGFPVSFTATGQCTLTDNTVHISGAGSCTVRASQPGDANFMAAPDVVQSFTIANSALVMFSQTNYDVNESTGFVTIAVNRTGDLSVPVNVDYTTDDTGASDVCGTLNSGMASARCDFGLTLGTLKFAATETQKTFTIPITQDSYAEGPELFTVKLSNPIGTGAALAAPASATVTINDSAAPAPNAIDDTEVFVRQQYRDFLNREADPTGLAFWTGEINNCTPKPQCTELKRIHASAAFFLSIEFQRTGNLVRNFYVAALNRPATNNMPEFVEFLRDTQAMQLGVIVDPTNNAWETVLNNNQEAFMKDFVTRAEFIGLYPTTDTPTQYVDKLYLHAGITPTAEERSNAIAEFDGAPTAADPAARGRAVLAVTENPTFQKREKNPSFVQMQYFGYLRRNPNDAPDPNFSGYDFWLAKLNQFGNFQDAEMVKAFISSDEYRHRFGP